MAKFSSGGTAAMIVKSATGKGFYEGYLLEGSMNNAVTMVTTYQRKVSPVLAYPSFFSNLTIVA